MAPPSCHHNIDKIQSVEEKNLSNISDSDLVDLCRKDIRPAWEEFFRRFIPTIKAAIQRILFRSGNPNLVDKENIIWEIHERVVKKLLCDDILKEEPTHIRSWLYRIAQNQTLDWLSEQGRQKRLPERVPEASTVSLFMPIGKDKDATIGDTIEDPSAQEMIEKLFDSELEGHDSLEKISTEVDKIHNPKQRWALRLGINLKTAVAC